MLEHLEGFTRYRIETNLYASISQKCHLDIVLNLLEVICQITTLLAALPLLYPSFYLLSNIFVWKGF